MAFFGKKERFWGYFELFGGCSASLGPWEVHPRYVRGYVPGGRGSFRPRTVPVPVPVRVKKGILCRKRRENIFFFGILDCLEAVLPTWAHVRSTVWSAACTWATYRYVSKKYLLSKEGAKNIFWQKNIQDVQPMFRRGDHFIVWGPHAYFDGFRSKKSFLCQEKARKYLLCRKSLSS